MSNAAGVLQVPPVPSEVTLFAVKNDVAKHLPPVLEMTRRIYPGRDIIVRLEEDAETADDWCIMLDVDMTDFDAQHIADTQWEWCSEVFDHCPATHVHFFRLGMVMMR